MEYKNSQLVAISRNPHDGRAWNNLVRVLDKGESVMLPDGTVLTRAGIIDMRSPGVCLDNKWNVDMEDVVHLYRLSLNMSDAEKIQPRGTHRLYTRDELVGEVEYYFSTASEYRLSELLLNENKMRIIPNAIQQSAFANAYTSGGTWRSLVALSNIMLSQDTVDLTGGGVQMTRSEIMKLALSLHGDPGSDASFMLAIADTIEPFSPHNTLTVKDKFKFLDQVSRLDTHEGKANVARHALLEYMRAPRNFLKISNLYEGDDKKYIRLLIGTAKFRDLLQIVINMITIHDPDDKGASVRENIKTLVGDMLKLYEYIHFPVLHDPLNCYIPGRPDRKSLAFMDMKPPINLAVQCARAIADNAEAEFILHLCQALGLDVQTIKSGGLPEMPPFEVISRSLAEFQEKLECLIPAESWK